jgi:hypothetical protein
LVRPDHTWADAARDFLERNSSLTIRHPTFHTVAKDV